MIRLDILFEISTTCQMTGVVVVVVVLLSITVHAQKCMPFPSIMCIRANYWPVYWSGSTTEAIDIDRNIRADYAFQSIDYLANNLAIRIPRDECLLVIRDVICASQIPRCSDDGVKKPICKDLCLAYQECFSVESPECRIWEDASVDLGNCSGHYIDWGEETSHSIRSAPILVVSALLSLVLS